MLSSSTKSDLRLRVPSNHLMLDLLGEHDAFIKRVEEAFPEVRLVARGNEIQISGPEIGVEQAHTVVAELLVVVQSDQQLTIDQVDRIVRMVQEDVPSPSSVFSAGITVGGGRVIRPKTLGQRRYLDAMRENTIVFGIGPAGTGKTYLAMASAVEALKGGAVRRILLTRPAVEAGERLGFLPGDLAAKIDPYLRPLYDALYDMLGPDETVRLMEQGIIEIAPLAYMRGRTLNDAYVILDEAQNTSPEQMKMFLTRLGFDSKMVITGDVTQVDLPSGAGSGLQLVRGILKGIDGIAFMELTARDVVRARIVAAIVEAYGRFDEENGRP